MTGLTVDEVKMTYVLNNINTSPNNNSTVSYDIFEKIDPNYQKDELEFKISLTSNYELAIVFAKAPPMRKVAYPELFNQSIHTDASFWNYSASNLIELCESDVVAPCPGKCFKVDNDKPFEPKTAAATRSPAKVGSPPKIR